MHIADRKIGKGEKAFIIAEIAQAHEGSLGLALSFIDAAAAAGADAIKFQTHIAHAESTRDEKFRIPMSGQDETRYDYWQRMEFTEKEWGILNARAAEKNIIFLSSAFSVEAVELLTKLDMPAWKVGSGEFRSRELLDAMIATGKPVLFSSGMSTLEEIDQGAKYFFEKNIPFALFQCTSMYPTPFDKVGLNILDTLKKTHDCPVGLSDHTGTIFPAMAAIARSADLIEIHVTFDKRMYGPDAIASLNFEELKTLCDMRDAVHIMDNNPVDKDTMAADLEKMRGLFTKSIGLKKDIKAGTVISQDMLCPKKPGTGIPYDEHGKVIGKKLLSDVPADRLLKWSDVE